IPRLETPRAPVEIVARPSAAGSSRKPLIIGIAVTGVVLVIAAVALMGGGKGNRGEVEVAVGVGSGPPPTPPPHRPLDPTSGVSTPPPPTSVVEEPARQAYQKALDLQQADPNNLTALLRAFEEVVQKFPTAAI